MRSIELLHKAVSENMFTLLTLDEVLTQLNVSHREYRTYLHYNNLDMYRPTKGMVDEILFAGLAPAAAIQRYYLSKADVQMVFYRNFSSNEGTIDKVKLISLVDQGKNNPDLAQMFGISESRVSQIKAKYGRTPSKRKPRKTLNRFQREDLIKDAQTHTPAKLAKKYGVSVPTVYRILQDDIT